MLSRSLKIVIAGEARSRNLGDPLLCEAMCRLVSTVDPRARIDLLDISGRAVSGDRGQKLAERGYLRNIAKKVIPDAIIRDLLWMDKKRDIKKRFHSSLSGADALIIAGGQLFMDNNLSFPRRLGLLLQACSELDVPTVIWACGAYENWSRKALSLVGSGLSKPNLLQVGLRDERSAAYVQKTFAVETVVRADPALAWLSGCHITGRSVGAADTPKIGVNVMAPIKAARVRGCAPSEVHDGYVRLLCDLSYKNITVFCNGEPCDIRYQNELYSVLPDDVRRQINWKTTPANESELVEIIKAVDELYCTRLHAGIIGWALGKRVLVMTGDRKTEALMESMGIEVDHTDWMKVSEAVRFCGTSFEGRLETYNNAIEEVRSVLQQLRERIVVNKKSEKGAGVG